MAEHYPILMWQTYLDEARTKLVWEAHVLFEDRGVHCMGQGSTPNRALKDAREALAITLEHFAENGLLAPKPMKIGFPVRFGMFGELGMFYPPHSTATTTCNGSTVSLRMEG